MGAFDTIIVTVLTTITKGAVKMGYSVDTIKEKTITEFSKKIQDSIGITLPFDIKDILNGGNLPPNILTPEYINKIPPLSESQKITLNKKLDEAEATVNSLVIQVNTLKSTIQAILDPLTTLSTLTTTLGDLIKVLKAAILVARLLPIPLFPLPMTAVNVVSMLLDEGSKTLDKYGGPLLAVAIGVEAIVKIFQPIIDKFSIFNDIFKKILQIIAFLRLLLSLPRTNPNVTLGETDLSLGQITLPPNNISNVDTYKWVKEIGNTGNNIWIKTEYYGIPPSGSLFGEASNPNGVFIGEFLGQLYFYNFDINGGVTQADIDQALLDVTLRMEKFIIPDSGSIFSGVDLIDKKALEDALLNQLDPNSLNPIIYKDFILTIEYDPDNTLGIPARRVKAEKLEDPGKGVILYSVPPDLGAGIVNTDSKYSFASSVQVLTDEVKYNIDLWYLGDQSVLLIGK